MATLLEIRQLFANDDFRNKVTAACVIKAEAMLGGTVDEKAYGLSVLQSPASVGRTVSMAVLAANAGATVAQIEGATDTAIQNKVDAAITNLVGV